MGLSDRNYLGWHERRLLAVSHGGAYADRPVAGARALSRPQARERRGLEPDLHGVPAGQHMHLGLPMIR